MDSLFALRGGEGAERSQNAPAAVSESCRGTVGSEDGLGIELATDKRPLPGLTLPANHQTKQRYSTGRGLTLRV
jgi:hypothetical protein